MRGATALRGAPSARVLALAQLSPQRAALELAWPGIVEQLVRASGGIVVFAFVGQLGAVATAAAGAALQFSFLLFPIFNALSIGTVALASRRLGEGRHAAAADVVRQSLVLGAVLGVLSGIAFAVAAEALLRLIGAADDVVALGAPYLAVVGGLNVFQTVSIIGVSAMRAAGDTRTPMLLSLGGSLLAVPSAVVLMNVLGLGIIGAAYAQVAISVLFAAMTIGLLWRGRAGLSIAHGRWGISRDTLPALAAISLPSAAESALFGVGILALGAVVFRLGTEAYAAHQIVGQLETISFLPCIGFAAAAATLVGQSLGMGDGARAHRVGWAATRMAALWTSAVGVAFLLLPAFWLALFTSDPGVVRAGLGSMILIGLAQPAQAVIFTIGGALRGAGDTRFTLLATAVNWFVVRFPLALLFAFPLGLGLAGVWAAIVVDYVVRAGLMALRFKGGRWQLRAV